MIHTYYIAFKHGLIWNVTSDKKTVEDWFDRRVIEGYEQYTYTGESAWHEDYPE